MMSSFQVRIRTLSKRLLSWNELGEKLRATIILGKFVNKLKLKHNQALIGLWFSENVFHWSIFKACPHDTFFS